MMEIFIIVIFWNSNNVYSEVGIDEQDSVNISAD